MHLLNNVKLWQFLRKFLDYTGGIYRVRIAEMQRFGIDRSLSVLDIGCGTGQYSQITDQVYLGIDLDPNYIAYAEEVYSNEHRAFQCVSLQDAALEGKKFDTSLLIDLTHHVSTEDVRTLLGRLAKVTGRYLVVADPVKQRPENWLGRIITALDRGKFIRPKAEELALLGEYFEILEVRDLKMLSIDSIMVFAKPK